MESNTTSDNFVDFGILIVDDTKTDRSKIAECFNSTPDAVIRECSSPSEIYDIPVSFNTIICFLDIKYDDGRDRIEELMEIIEERWPMAIKVIVSSYVSSLSEDILNRVDDKISKLSFKLNPKLLNTISEDVANTRKKQGNWNFSPHISFKKRKYLQQFRGYVQEINYPFIEVVVEDNNNEKCISRHLIMPYDLFSSVGILGQDMRFRYFAYIEDNRLVSEILPPEDDISWDENDTPAYLDELDNLEEQKRKEKNK